MLPFLGDNFGNANSLHQWGAAAEHGVEMARMHVAELIGAEDPSEIVFTSGATEANNWVLRLAAEQSWKTYFSTVEHSSVDEPGKHFGFEYLGFDGEGGFLPVEADLVSCILINNETGNWFNRRVDSGAVRVHRDITQAAGKIEMDVTEWDFASLSAHKLYGPKGVGALYVRGGAVDPLLYGGAQESGRRSGTLNVPGIVGFGEAARIAKEDLAKNWTHAGSLNDLVQSGLAGVEGMRLNVQAANSPYILSVSFQGIEGEALVIDLDRNGFAVSSGAACSSGSNLPSHVLLAMGVDPEFIRGTIRISFSKFNTWETTQALTREIVESVSRLRRLG